MNRRHGLVMVISLSVLALVLPFAASFPDGLRDLVDDLSALLAMPGSERSEGYYTLVDERGGVLLQTALRIHKGDLFIDAQDDFHEIVRLRGDVAETRLVAPESVPVSIGAVVNSAAPGPQAIPLGTARQVIVIYHTHSDESYVPTDGVQAIPGAGGVYDVGDTLAATLSSAGFTVVHDKAAHDPHDAGAYPRSRRTVLRNLGFGPTFLFDVHRDASPPSAYLTIIDGVQTSKILIVVGGGNPMYRSNLGVARQLRTVAETLYPGLIRGILVAKGNYNQDLDPGAILLEMGTYVIPKPPAQRAATLWANVVTAFLGPPGPDLPGAAPEAPQSAPRLDGQGR